METSVIEIIKSARRIPASRLHAACVALATLLLLAGCSGGSHATASGRSPAGGPTAAPVSNPVAAAATDAAAAIPAAGGLAGRTGVLTNPGNSQMVFLYYDLAGIPPPIDQWIEEDSRVQSAPGASKAALRTQVKAELQAGLAAVRGVGVLHLTTNANVSQYDPTYGEFTLGALTPASEYTFDALHRHVLVKLDNGLAAQTWSVPGDKAQAITDQLGDANPVLDVVLDIVKVLPDTQGGTLVTHVVSWTLRDTRHGTTFARVEVPRG
jgi:hypothetical protein